VSKRKQKSLKGIDYLQLDDGANLYFHAIPPLAPQLIQDTYTEQNPEPKPPTYEVESVGDVKVTFEHDKTSLSTKEEKEDFAAYEQAHNVWQSGLTSLLLNLFIEDGTRLEMSDKIRTKWERKAGRYGIKLSDDKEEYKVQLLKLIGISDGQTIQAISQGVMRKTGVPEEELRAAEKLF
jgi:hypothetical protein